MNKIQIVKTPDNSTVSLGTLMDNSSYGTLQKWQLLGNAVCPDHEEQSKRATVCNDIL
jgi:hypothetical protein